MAKTARTACLALLCAAGSSWAQAWQIEEVVEGTKPELAVDITGVPHIAFMVEAHQGFVGYAVKDGEV